VQRLGGGLAKGRRKMMRKLSYRLKEVLGQNPPGRRFTIFEDDVFITSYPKSGNTWIRFLIANLIHPEGPVTFLNIGHILPDPEWQSRNILKRCPRPRVIKSHHPFDPRYKKVVFIVRDPRDIVLSEHFFLVKRGAIRPDTSIEEYVERFVKGETTDYGSWGQNVGSWLLARYKTPGFLLLRYEDLIERPLEGLKEIASFLDLSGDEEQLARSVQLSSADHMRRLENEQADQWEVTKATRKDMPFMRSARPGGWKSSLPAESLARMEYAWGKLMQALGYELMSTATGTSITSTQSLDRLTALVEASPLEVLR
jgi:hypothetical protein